MCIVVKDRRGYVQLWRTEGDVYNCGGQKGMCIVVEDHLWRKEGDVYSCGEQKGMCKVLENIRGCV